MQETNKDSSRTPLTIEQLLQLKRLEKPSEEFWAGFERELQQKQLKALVKPSLWARMWGVLSAAPAHLAPVSAAAALCVTAGLIGFSFFAGEKSIEGVALHEQSQPSAGSLALAEADPASVEAQTKEEIVVAAPRADFVTDVIVPEARAVPAGSFDTYYVVNAFERASQQLGAGKKGAFEF